MAQMSKETAAAMDKLKQQEETEAVLELLGEYRDEIRAVINPILGLDALEAAMKRLESKVDAIIEALDTKDPVDK